MECINFKRFIGGIQHVRHHPFSKTTTKLYKDIKSSHNSQHYETVYQLIEDYEAQFELDETLALIKCDMLYHLNSFLELREEAIVLLKEAFKRMMS